MEMVTTNSAPHVAAIGHGGDDDRGAGLPVLHRKRVFSPAMLVILGASLALGIVGALAANLLLFMIGLVLFTAVGTWLLLAGLDRLQQPIRIVVTGDSLVLKRRRSSLQFGLDAIFLERATDLRAAGASIARKLRLRIPRSSGVPIDTSSKKAFKRSSKRLHLASVHFHKGHEAFAELASMIPVSPY